ncbi:procollagen galactosyltransferase 1-like isoform X2 [Saccostrea echinata]|uniref:procollagen galactosyltransferase 1-like isoform X2 n=1 Tax=Saccostrea echinata TaxID=191078 RepID=UPI002A839B1E|nr:procollagen galactosyltransferase 1-like isoform X2 [Saccostrea echinata]
MGSWLTCLVFCCFYVAFIGEKSFFVICEDLEIKAAVENDFKYAEPTVMIAILVRNKAHVLPWFFGHLENLNYPKNRVSIWIRSDHNEDDTPRILTEWTEVYKDIYHSIDIEIDRSTEEYDDAEGPLHWSEERFDRVISLREEALQSARKVWADYLFMLDADVILENPDTLTLLIDAKQPIVAPMLNASVGDTYSNFWGAMDESGYYKRAPGYFDVLERKKLGVFQVPMVHSAVLIDMHLLVSDKFTYNKPPGYEGPHNDIIIFGLNVRDAGMVMHIMNSEYFGIVMVPLEKHNTLEQESEHFDYIRLMAIVDRAELIKSRFIKVSDPIPTKLGFDQIYLINLVRRPIRRERMHNAFKILGIEARTMDAVDGKQLNTTYLKKLDIEMMEGYADPYHDRPLTMGEIGCFLSHYFIWEDVVKNGFKQSIIFEDDVRFRPYFKSKLTRLVDEVAKTVKDWDLIYLGRKRLHKEDEKLVDGASYLVWPTYSYWTLSYIVSLQGAQKLLNQKPLRKMIPVDEYLPIMFNQHPREEWMANFSPRDLVTLSAEPLLVEPTHYTGEPNYISDTEDSFVVHPQEDVNQSDKASKEEL